MKPEVTEARVSFSAGTTLLLSVLTVLLCAALLFNQSYPPVTPEEERVRPRRGNTGSIGDISAKEIEAKYGPVNHSAANEVKQGLLFRRRLSCAPQASSHCSQPLSRSCGLSCSRCALPSQRATRNTPMPSVIDCAPALADTNPCDTGGCSVDAPIATPPSQAPEVAVRPLPSEGYLRIVPSI